MDGLFTLHWLYLENEVWLDSDAGWIAVVDDAANYGMVERFQYFSSAEYPGKASVIFYKNGAALELDANGMPKLRSATLQQAPYYMEAELNSPTIRLEPDASYVMETRWFPVRADKGLKAVTPAGVVLRALAASLTAKGLQLSGSFGAFPGKTGCSCLRSPWVRDRHGGLAVRRSTGSGGTPTNHQSARRSVSSLHPPRR